MSETMVIEHPVEHVTTLRLNRPDRLNALDYSLAPTASRIQHWCPEFGALAPPRS